MSAALDVRGQVRRHHRLLITLATLVVLYTVLGFLIVPWIARGQLEKRLSALLHRQVSIEHVRMNPYTLSVTIQNLSVKALDGPELMGFDRLFVDAKLWPVVRREIGLDEVELVNYRFRLLQLRDGSLNIEDIIRSLTAESPGPAPQEKPSEPWVFGVDRLAIEQASVAFEDLSRGHPFKTIIGPFTIRLADFRTRPDTDGTYAFDGATDSGEHFAWNGTVGIGPLRSEGSLSLTDLQLPKYAPYYEGEVGFDLRSGALGVRGSYKAEWGPQRRAVRIIDGVVELRDLSLALRGAKQPAVELPVVNVTGIQADVLANQVEVGAVNVEGGVVRARRGPEGAIDLVAMGKAPGGGSTGSHRADATEPAPAEPPSAAPPGPTAAPGKHAAAKPALRWLVKRIGVNKLDVHFDDELPQRPVALALAPLSVTLTNLTSDRSAKAGLEASTVLNGAGKLELKGPFSPWHETAELEVHGEGLELTPLDPYLLLYGDLDARLPSGRISFDGRSTVDALAEPLAYTFAGNVRVDDLSLADAARNEELVRWKSLELEGLQAAAKPAPYVLETVRWTEPQVRVRVAPDGSSNLARVLRTPPAPKEEKGKADAPAEVAEGSGDGTKPDAAKPSDTGGVREGAAEPVKASAEVARPVAGGSTGSGEGAPDPDPAKASPDGAKPSDAGGQNAPAQAKKDAPSAKPPTAAPPPPGVQYSIALFRILRGSVGFVDKSIRPSAVLTVSSLDVNVKNLSSQVTARSAVAVRGRIGGAPLEVKGTLSPRMVNDATSISITSKGVDLTPLGPYCGKYVGYLLEKGKLDLDLAIKVAKRNLKGQNVVKVDQLTLGQKTGSPDATKLPVKLGLAVLRDKDNLIVLDVPVEGNVDEPNFRLGRVIWRAIINVFTKIATKPWAALGALLGDDGTGGSPDVLEFQPGEANLAKDSDKAIESLTKVLTARPGLELDIEGVATEAADLPALQRQVLEQRAKEAKWKALPTRSGLSGPGDLNLVEPEYRAFVESQYREGIPRPAQPANASKHPNAPSAQPVPSAEEMEAAVLSKVEIPPEALQTLAQQRAEAARDRLAAAGIDAGRLFLTSGSDRASKEGGARAYVSLK